MLAGKQFKNVKIFTTQLVSILRLQKTAPDHKYAITLFAVIASFYVLCGLDTRAGARDVNLSASSVKSRFSRAKGSFFLYFRELIHASAFQILPPVLSQVDFKLQPSTWHDLQTRSISVSVELRSH